MNDAELIAALAFHAYDDCGEQDIPTHICNIAATRLETLTAENERLREALVDVTHFGDRQAVGIARAALKQGEQ